MKKGNPVKKLTELLTIIREEAEKLKQTIIEVRKEREQLEFIKSLLEDNSPKIDISNVYVFKNNKIKYLVRYEITDGRVEVPLEKVDRNERYQSNLRNILNNKIVYKTFQKGILKRKIYIESSSLYNLKGEEYNAKLTPILEVDPNLLAYTDGLVPKYLLEQLSYKLNHVEVNAPVLQKLSKN